MIKYTTKTSDIEQNIYLSIFESQNNGYRYDTIDNTYYVADSDMLLFLMHSYAHLINLKINDSDQYTIAESYDLNPNKLLIALNDSKGIDLIENYLNNYLNENQQTYEYEY